MTDLTSGIDAAPATKPKEVALSAVVLGVLAVVLAVIPGADFVAFVPGLLALVMGIFGLRDPAQGSRRSLAGVVLGPVAILVSILTVGGALRL
jgi:hypothetical protein